MDFDTDLRAKNPDWENNHELKALNEKCQHMASRLDAMEKLLRTISSNIATVAKNTRK